MWSYYFLLGNIKISFSIEKIEPKKIDKYDILDNNREI